jgi:hypothetical protein
MPKVNPNIEDLQRRCIAQLARHGNDDEVIHLWCGYLAALLEWGLIGDDAYNAVSALLPRVGGEALLDFFGHASPAEQRPAVTPPLRLTAAPRPAPIRPRLTTVR